MSTSTTDRGVQRLHCRDVHGGRERILQDSHMFVR